MRRGIESRLRKIELRQQVITDRCSPEEVSEAAHEYIYSGVLPNDRPALAKAARELGDDLIAMSNTLPRADGSFDYPGRGFDEDPSAALPWSKFLRALPPAERAEIRALMKELTPAERKAEREAFEDLRQARLVSQRQRRSAGIESARTTAGPERPRIEAGFPFDVP